MLFGRAANFFGICQQKQLKLTVFCALQRKFWNLSRATHIDLFSRAAKKVELRTNTVFCSAAQRKILE
jgi:hypothetical protein